MARFFRYPLLSPIYYIHRLGLNPSVHPRLAGEPSAYTYYPRILVLEAVLLMSSVLAVWDSVYVDS